MFIHILFQTLWCVNGSQEKGFGKISGDILRLCMNAALLKVDVGKSKVMIDEWEGEAASVVKAVVSLRRPMFR